MPLGIQILMGGVIKVSIQPNMMRLIDEVRDGKLDHALTKPEDAQVLVSVREVRIWQVVDLVHGARRPRRRAVPHHDGCRPPRRAGVRRRAPRSVRLMIYCFWLVIATGAFWVVNMWHVADLFDGVFQTGRWPVGIYPGWLRYSVTFLVPVAFAVTVPAQAVTSRLEWQTLRARRGVRRRAVRIRLAGSGASGSGATRARRHDGHWRADLALRPRCALVGRVQPRRARDRLLPALRRGRPAGARRRLRHRSAADPVCSRPGLDVDGCDISPDMLERCRERAEQEGLAPKLYAQAVHELDLPRSYRTIVFCGGFGLGGRREHDVEGLRRLYEHLEPGGTLVLDNEAPYADSHLWPLLAARRPGRAAASVARAGRPSRRLGRRRVRPALAGRRPRSAVPARHDRDARLDVARRRARGRGGAPPRADDVLHARGAVSCSSRRGSSTSSSAPATRTGRRPPTTTSSSSSRGSRSLARLPRSV